MKTIAVCKYCGSARIFQDAILNINRNSFDTYDDQSCENCCADSHSLAITVEVPDDFDIDEDIFDLEKLK